MAKTKIEIKANKREEIGKKNKKLRGQGLVPAVVYGRKFKAASVSVDLKEFNKKVMRSDAGHNLIFTLKVSGDGKAQDLPVITHNIQRNSMTDEIIHLDFMYIVMDEVIKARIPVELRGVPCGVKDEGGVLVHGLREVEIKCLPMDIPDKFEVDVSGLAINTSLHVSDLKLNAKVEILADEDEMIATVSPPSKEEEVAPVPLTPEEVGAAAAATEASVAVAGEEVKEKSAPGAPPPVQKKESKQAK